MLQVSIGMAVLCIPWLRWRHPEWERPIRVSLVWPVLYILATVFITLVPMVARPFETGMGCVMILTALPVYFIFIHWKQKPALITNILSIKDFFCSYVISIFILFDSRQYNRLPSKSAVGTGSVTKSSVKKLSSPSPCPNPLSQ